MCVTNPHSCPRQIRHVPAAFSELGRWLVETETLILGGPDLWLPPDHAWPDGVTYSGPVYLIADIDPGPGKLFTSKVEGRGGGGKNKN